MGPASVAVRSAITIDANASSGREDWPTRSSTWRFDPEAPIAALFARSVGADWAQEEVQPVSPLRRRAKGTAAGADRCRHRRRVRARTPGSRCSRRRHGDGLVLRARAERPGRVPESVLLYEWVKRTREALAPAERRDPAAPGVRHNARRSRVRVRGPRLTSFIRWRARSRWPSRSRSRWSPPSNPEESPTTCKILRRRRRRRTRPVLFAEPSPDRRPGRRRLVRSRRSTTSVSPPRSSIASSAAKRRPSSRGSRGNDQGVAMRQFSMGSVYALPSGANPTPIPFGILKSASVDVKQAKVADPRQQEGPDRRRRRRPRHRDQDRARGLPRVVPGDDRGRQHDRDRIEDRRPCAERSAVPTTPFQVTVAQSATFSEDAGVFDVTAGKWLTQGRNRVRRRDQYAVAAGVYTFNTADVRRTSSRSRTRTRPRLGRVHDDLQQPAAGRRAPATWCASTTCSSSLAC
jgi:hypothetical protein